MRDNKMYKFAVTNVELDKIDWNNNDCVMFTTEYEPEDAAHTFFEEYANKNNFHDRVYYVKNLDKDEIYRITIKPEKSVVWLTDKVTKIN